MTLPSDTTRSQRPHIRRRFGIWYCGYVDWLWGGAILPPYGEGYTPSEALKDWKEQFPEAAAVSAATN